MKYIIILLLVGNVFARWQWTPLFDGKSFEGWFFEGDTSFWKINSTDSSIEGKSFNSTPYSMLFTDREFDLFTIKYQQRLMSGCSGFFFRAQNLSSGALVRGMRVAAKYRSGQQAEVGSLYCHDCGNSSGWGVQHTDGYSASITNPVNQYQQYYLTVDSSHIYVNVNGYQATGETEDSILMMGANKAYDYRHTDIVNSPGRIGLQSGLPSSYLDVRYRNILILQACLSGEYKDLNLPEFVEGTGGKHPAVYEHNEELCEPTSVHENHGKKKFEMNITGKFISMVPANKKENYFLSVYDLNGELIKRLKGLSDEVFQLDVKMGVYFLKLSGRGLSSEVFKVNIF